VVGQFTGDFYTCAAGQLDLYTTIMDLNFANHLAVDLSAVQVQVFIDTLAAGRPKGRTTS